MARKAKDIKKQQFSSSKIYNIVSFIHTIYMQVTHVIGVLNTQLQLDLKRKSIGMVSKN